MKLLIMLQLTLGSLLPGDLIFQDCECGPICEAIEDVTEGYRKARYSHIGMVVRDSTTDSLRVIEANTSGVVMVPLTEFVYRYTYPDGKPRVHIGRLRNRYRHLIPSAVSYATSQLGKSYDYGYSIHNDSFYCSELIYEAYKWAYKGKELFRLAPMNFCPRGSSSPHPEFVRYYKKLQMAIPQGQLGINPGSISRSRTLTIHPLIDSPSP